MIENSNIPHIPVLLNQVLSYITHIPHAKTFVDATFGAGGYSRAILENSNMKVIGIDQDPSTHKYAEILKNDFGDRFSFIEGNFRNISKLISDKVDGFVFDLGISSMQVDDKERGFSFQKNALLDMRMSSSGVSAFDIVNSYEEEKLANIIYKYGEERSSRAIANLIVKSREESPIKTTFELAEIVRKIVKKTGKIDPATKTFQAIRIEVNDEMNALSEALESATEKLSAGGRLAVVTFHGLEDKIVKDFLLNNSDKKIAKSKYSKEKELFIKPLKILSKKPIQPDFSEIKNNPRARSSKLRIAEKR